MNPNPKWRGEVLSSELYKPMLFGPTKIKPPLSATLTNSLFSCCLSSVLTSPNHAVIIAAVLISFSTACFIESTTAFGGTTIPAMSICSGHLSREG